MNERTCAVCDYVLDDNAIEVKIGDNVVEVCCEGCAAKLREASTAAAASSYQRTPASNA